MTVRSYKYEVWINIHRVDPCAKRAGKGGKSYIRVRDYQAAEVMMEGLRMMAKLQGWTRNDAFKSTVFGNGCIVDQYNEGCFTALERSIAIEYKGAKLFVP